LTHLRARLRRLHRSSSTYFVIHLHGAAATRFTTAANCFMVASAVTLEASYVALQSRAISSSKDRYTASCTTVQPPQRLHQHLQELHRLRVLKKRSWASSFTLYMLFPFFQILSEKYYYLIL
jgi:hypothetical protein